MLPQRVALRDQAFVRRARVAITELRLTSVPCRSGIRGLCPTLSG